MSRSRGNSAFDLVAQFMGRQNTIPVPVPFVRLLGDHEAASFLSQVLYWGDRTEDAEGWFHKTHDEWYEELVLSPDQVRRCVRTCKGLVEVKRRGIPARNFYRSDREAVAAALQQLAAGDARDKSSAMSTTRCGETQQLEVEKPNNKAQGNPTAVRGESPRQVVRETQHLITEPTSEPTQNLKDKKHFAADAAVRGWDESDQTTDRQDLQGITSQVELSASEGTQGTQATGTEEVPAGGAAAGGGEGVALALLEVWNTHRGPLPAAEALNEGRRKAIKKLLRDCDGDQAKAAAVLADAAREAATDEFWIARRYGFDNLVPGKVFQKAEAWHARAQSGRQPTRAAAPDSAGYTPQSREEWLS